VREILEVEVIDTLDVILDVTEVERVSEIDFDIDGVRVRVRVCVALADGVWLAV
jgi:hypothetical protein